MEASGKMAFSTPGHVDGRALLAAEIVGRRAARGEGAAGRRIVGVGKLAAFAFRHSDRLAGNRGGIKQQPCVVVKRAGEDLRDGPISAMRPKYITATRSDTLSTTERSWLMKT
jgi:hypothetical protein